MNKPLASIVVATYTKSPFLERQLESLLDQSYPNLEIVISHDDNHDGTFEILKRYENRDRRVRVIKNLEKKGFKGNFENGLKNAKGEIVFFCDHDDVWYKDKVLRHMEVYDKLPDVKWVYNHVVLTDISDRVIGYLEDRASMYWEPRSLLQMTWGSCILGCATSFRRHLIINKLPIHQLAGGHDSWLELTLWPAKGYFIKETLQEYRQHENNLSGWLHDDKGNELQAINDNLVYIKSLKSDKRLSIISRFILTCVYPFKLFKYRKKIS